MRAEELVRAMAVASDDLVGVADHPTTGKIYRESVIVGAISYALKIGELLREGKENSLDIPSHIANNAEGKVLFRGVVSSAPWACVDGFDIGEIFIDGTGTDDGDKYKIWYKNENLISYKNGEIDVTCPDLICCFDKDGIPITNPDVKVGENITVIALRAPEIWKTPEGLACFGPKSFGFDVEYIPFQEKK